MQYSRFLRLINFLLATCSISSLYSQGVSQMYYGPGTGLLIREDPSTFIIASRNGAEYECLLIDKNSNTLLSSNSLGAVGFGIIPAANGDYLKLDTISDPDNGLRDFRLSRVQADGTLRWSNHFGDNSGGYNFTVYDAIETANGDFVAIGHSDGYPLSGRVSRLIRVSSDGQQLLLEKTIVGEFTDIEKALDGDGFFLRGAVLDTSGYYVSTLKKTDLNGSDVWTYSPLSSSGSSGYLFHLQPTEDGGVLISEQLPGNYPRVFKRNSVGQEDWSFTILFLGTFFDIGSLVENAGGGATFLFNRALGGGGQTVVDTRTMMIRVDQAGHQQWLRNFESACKVPGPMGTITTVSRFVLNNIISTMDGGFAAVGQGGDSLACGQLVLVRTDANGNTVGANVEPSRIFSGQLYPNPAHDQLTLLFPTSAAGTVVLEFYDSRGKVCHRASTSLDQGANKIYFDIADWPAGVYSIVGKKRDLRSTQQFVFPPLVMQH